jgi:hypothetical protein
MAYFAYLAVAKASRKDSEPSRGVHRGLTGPDQLLLVSPREYVERRVHGDPVLDRIVHLPDDGFEGP